MGFFDGVRRKLQRVTEETVGVSRYDDPEEPREKPEPPAEASAPSRPSVFAASKEREESVSSFLEEKDRDHQDLLDAFKDPSRSKGVLEARAKDILEVLKIPATFTLDASVLLPEDFEEISFDLQAPQGYEVGEVDAFLARAEKSVSELVRLLRLRNQHVAELATTVDRLQVDAQNAKFDAQVANGLSIMPTNDASELEHENMGLRLLVGRLEKELEASRQQVTPEQPDESLADRVSVLTHENEQLQATVYDLRNRLAVLEESSSVLDEVSSGGGLPGLSDDDFDPGEVHTGFGSGAGGGSVFASADESLDSFIDRTESFALDDEGEEMDGILSSFTADSSYADSSPARVG